MRLTAARLARRATRSRLGRSCLVALWLVACADGPPQPPAPRLHVTHGAHAADTAFGIAPVADGLVVVGTVRHAAGHDDLRLVHTDRDGRAIWQRSYGGGQDDGGRRVLALPDGSLAVLGTTASQGKGLADFWLLRCDPGGSKIWERTYGGIERDEAHDLAAATDGFVLAGVTREGEGKEQARLVRTDAAGEVRWVRSYGEGGMEAANAVVVLADGGLAFAGTRVPPGGGQVQAWLVRTDATGEPLWQRTYGETAWTGASALAALPDGGFVWVGAALRPADAGVQTFDALVVRTDASGEPTWQRHLGGSGDDLGHAVHALPGGDLLVAGQTQPTPVDHADLLLVRLEASGQERWRHAYGGAGDDAAFALTATAGGGSALAGGSHFRLVIADAAGHAPERYDSPADPAQAVDLCAGRAAGACDDGNVCTLDTCQKAFGCVNEVRPDGTPCGFGKTCQTGICTL